MSLYIPLYPLYLHTFLSFSIILYIYLSAQNMDRHAAMDQFSDLRGRQAQLRLQRPLRALARHLRRVAVPGAVAADLGVTGGAPKAWCREQEQVRWMSFHTACKI